MSHFSVLVKVTSERLAKHDGELGAAVKEMLRPYQEDNMGDCPKEYLEFFDAENNQKYRDEYNSGTTTMVRLADGQVVDANSDTLFRDPSPEEKTIGLTGTGFSRNLYWTSKDWGDGRGYRPKVHYIPEGAEEIELPFPEVYPTFEDYLRDYKGFAVDSETGRYGYWENPNAKWDYWTIGGRWAGLLHSLQHGGPCDYGQLSQLAKVPSTYAVLDDNGWHARGQMGMWGITLDETESQEDWYAKFHERFLDNEPPDTTLVVVDCHI